MIVYMKTPQKLEKLCDYIFGKSKEILQKL